MNIKINRSTTSRQDNVDLNEIATFNSIASNWWNLNGQFKPLHRINPLRLNYILVRAEGLFRKEILDVGCGGGILTECMAREGGIVTGLDVAYESLLIARLHALHNQTKIVYIQQTVEEHAQMHHKKYDVVTCMEMLEHVPNPALIVQACSKLVKPGGDVFFSTLNRNIKSWLLAIVGAEYLLRIVPRGTHHINKFIKPSELLSWIDNTALSEQNITGLSYNPIYDRFNLSTNIDVNYMLHTKHQK